MDKPWAIIGWIVVAVIGACIAAFAFGMIRVLVSQMFTDWRRKRAHAGKVTCEGEDVERIFGDERNLVGSDKVVHKCNQIAVRVTPNGYFCDDHWMENSRKVGMYAGISYGHLLNHAMKERRAG